MLVITISQLIGHLLATKVFKWKFPDTRGVWVIIGQANASLAPQLRSCNLQCHSEAIPPMQVSYVSSIHE
jgi:hypothetical protein